MVPLALETVLTMPVMDVRNNIGTTLVTLALEQCVDDACVDDSKHYWNNIGVHLPCSSVLARLVLNVSRVVPDY